MPFSSMGSLSNATLHSKIDNNEFNSVHDDLKNRIPHVFHCVNNAIGCKFVVRWKHNDVVLDWLYIWMMLSFVKTKLLNSIMTCWSLEMTSKTVWFRNTFVLFFFRTTTFITSSNQELEKKKPPITKRFFFWTAFLLKTSKELGEKKQITN